MDSHFQWPVGRGYSRYNNPCTNKYNGCLYPVSIFKYQINIDTMKKLFLFLLAGIYLQTTFAQHRSSSFAISYPIAFPMSDLKNYISKTSFRGINMEWYKHIKSNVGVGFETGWNVFYQKENFKT